MATGGKPTVAILLNPELERQVLDEHTITNLKRLFDLVWPKGKDQLTPEQAADMLTTADGCLTSWGSPSLTPEVLRAANGLRIMAHAAGSVKPYVSEEIWKRKIVVTTAANVIAIDVAHYTIALMIVGRKNVMELAAQTATGEWNNVWGHRPPDDLRGCTVGIVSASQVGRTVMELLRHFDVNLLLFDPSVTQEEARALGATRVELSDLFRRSDIISLHAPTLFTTRHLVNGARLALMKNGSIIINTSRGALVDEAALIAELKKRRIWAFLDTTDPEPPPPDSPLYGCPNLTLTPHIAGSVGRGRRKIGELACEELRRFFTGLPPLYAVTREQLERSA